MLVYSLPINIRKRWTDDVIDICVSHAGLVRDVRDKLPSITWQRSRLLFGDFRTSTVFFVCYLCFCFLFSFFFFFWGGGGGGGIFSESYTARRLTEGQTESFVLNVMATYALPILPVSRVSPLS